jgi:hypothetical protein
MAKVLNIAPREEHRVGFLSVSPRVGLAIVKICAKEHCSAQDVIRAILEQAIDEYNIDE